MGLIDGLARVTFLSYYASGQAVSNTIHVVDPGAGSPPDLTELTNLLGDIDTYFTTAYRACLLTGDKLAQYTAAQVADPTTPGAVVEAIRVKNLAGTIAQTRTMPQSASVLCDISTNVAAKWARGHLFLPGYYSGAGVSGDIWTAGSVTMFDTLVTKYNDGCTLSPVWTGTTLSNYSLAIFSKQQNKVIAPQVTIAFGATRNAKVHWLRSRERGST
jgi:hypothetical protein